VQICWAHRTRNHKYRNPTAPTAKPMNRLIFPTAASLIARKPQTRRYLAVMFTGLVVALALASAVVAWVGQRTGSTTSFARIVERQREDPALIALPFNLRYWAMYKLVSVALYRPEIVYISSSRAGEFREQMFRPYSFHNLSFTAWTLDQATAILDRVSRTNAPRIAIVEFDYFMFTASWPRANADRSMHFNAEARYKIESGIDALRSLAKRPDLLHDCNVRILQTNPGCETVPFRYVEIQAIRAEEGFRWDGSYRYSVGRLDSSAQNLTAKFLIQSMPGARNIDPGQIAALERLAALARERGITLIGIQLPLVKEGVDFLDQDPSYHNNAGVWREFDSKQMRDKFRSLGIHFFDLGRASFADDKKNFVDAYHPSELGTLRSMIDLCNEPDFRLLLPALDPARLKRDLENAERQGKVFEVY
jgi:hypothetical protein